MKAHGLGSRESKRRKRKQTLLNLRAEPDAETKILFDVTHDVCAPWHDVHSSTVQEHLKPCGQKLYTDAQRAGRVAEMLTAAQCGAVRVAGARAGFRYYAGELWLRSSDQNAGGEEAEQVMSTSGPSLG
ncbi:hypothetical protein CYMTET_13990 [Cymbomonas tetramitiformis]|uniref:Uncharacterized protein n=1 Tax=Cymbomonas tetramitiformis TaxID=36881 RepID=A0AAE0LAG5_9CHLO|nr:hypothetical protein CYMTET_13990 [Cymbomonas tetramitiformis]